MICIVWWASGVGNSQEPAKFSFVSLYPFFFKLFSRCSWLLWEMIFHDRTIDSTNSTFEHFHDKDDGWLLELGTIWTIFRSNFIQHVKASISLVLSIQLILFTTQVGQDGYGCIHCGALFCRYSIETLSLLLLCSNFSCKYSSRLMVSYQKLCIQSSNSQITSRNWSLVGWVLLGLQ